MADSWWLLSGRWFGYGLSILAPTCLMLQFATAELFYIGHLGFGFTSRAQVSTGRTSLSDIFSLGEKKQGFLVCPLFPLLSVWSWLDGSLQLVGRPSRGAGIQMQEHALLVLKPCGAPPRRGGDLEAGWETNSAARSASKNTHCCFCSTWDKTGWMAAWPQGR